jgi:hypothetical protein
MLLMSVLAVIMAAGARFWLMGRLSPTVYRRSIYQLARAFLIGMG